ncbi:MAG TPA: hypothetical protein VFY69_03645 [Solirubrobacterales bacterium]|nr:hypothetical protein [Solirubrobacterales bacterium]
MATHAVRFKGILHKVHFERLEKAGVTIQSKEPSMQLGAIKTGRPIYTVTLEAASPEEALARVRELLMPDTSTFVDWEAVNE